jgi:hypothetical protein
LGIFLFMIPIIIYTILKSRSPMGALKQHPQMVCGRVCHIVFFRWIKHEQVTLW